MKIFFVLMICLILSVPSVAQEGKRNSGFNKSTKNANTKSSFQHNNSRASYNRNNTIKKINHTGQEKPHQAPETSAAGNSSKNVNIHVIKKDISAKKSQGVSNTAVRKNVNVLSKQQPQKSNNSVNRNDYKRNKNTLNSRPQHNGGKNNNTRPSYNINNSNKNNSYNRNKYSGRTNSGVSYNYGNKNKDKRLNYLSFNRPSHPSQKQNYNKRPSHNYRYYPRTYYPYSYYHRPAAFRSAVNFLLFPFGHFYSGYSYYPYDSRYYSSGNTVYYNYMANHSYFSSDKLSADYTMLNQQEDTEYSIKKSAQDLTGIKLQNTRLVTGEGNSIGFEINNGSMYYIAAISFKITIRAVGATETKNGNFYKLEKPLASGEKEFYRISLDDLSLDFPDPYSVFAEIESITTPLGDTIINGR